MSLSPRVIMEPEQATAAVSNAAHHHEFSDLAAVAQHDSVGSATASIRPGRGQGRLQAAVRGHWQRWPGAQKYGDHLSITPVMRRAAAECHVVHFILSNVHRATLFWPLTAAEVFACCGHIGLTRRRGKSTNGCFAVRLDF